MSQLIYGSLAGSFRQRLLRQGGVFFHLAVLPNTATPSAVALLARLVEYDRWRAEIEDKCRSFKTPSDCELRALLHITDDQTGHHAFISMFRLASTIIILVNINHDGMAYEQSLH